jgi:hypothetical protein
MFVSTVWLRSCTRSCLVTIFICCSEYGNSRPQSMQHTYARPARSRCGHVVWGCTQSNRYARIHFSQLIIDLFMRNPLGTCHVTQIGSGSIWRGDRDASCTSSGKGQEGVVAVYPINNGYSSTRRIVWHGCLVEHAYHAFGRGLLKAEDDAG